MARKGNYVDTLLFGTSHIAFDRTDGEHNRSAKLTDDAVRTIRDVCDAIEDDDERRQAYHELAARFDVNIRTVSKVARRKAWLHVKE